MSRIKVEGYTDLERERESGAIVNTNRIEYVQFMTKYRNKQAEKQKVALCDEINTLKDEMNEIKNMLIKVLEK